MGLSAGSFTRGDIYKNQGRNTAEVANQGMATAEAAKPAPSPLGAANTGGPMQGSPAAVIVVIILLFAALRVFSIRSGDGEDYAGVVPSFYNIMVITLAGMLGGTLLKWVVTKALPSNNALRAFVVQA